MTVSVDVLEALGAHYVKSGNENAAARCFALALTMVMPTEIQVRIRFRYGCLLLPFHKRQAFEQLERALRMAKTVNELGRLRVGLVCAMVTVVSNKQLMTELFREHIGDVTEDTVVAFLSAFLQAAILHQFDASQCLELIENAIASFPNIKQLELLRGLYTLLIGRPLAASTGQDCALSIFLNLANSISQQDHSNSERLLSILLPIKLDSFQLNNHVVLFQNCFRFAVKSLCIIQSSIDGKTPHTELYQASEKVIMKSPSRISGHIRSIVNILKHIDGQLSVENFNVNCPMFYLKEHSQTMQVLDSIGDEYLNDYLEFVNSCKLIIQGNTPIHHIKSKLLIVLKHVNTVSQDAFLRAGVMLLLGLMYVETDPDLSQKMLLVADRFGKSCNNKVIMSFM